MAQSSSTSSSDPGARWGRARTAALIALGLVVAAEVALRIPDPKLLIPYEPGVLRRISTREHLRAYGAPDVMIVGTSRGQAAWVVPRIREALAGRLATPPRVESYAAGAGSGLEAFHQVDWMLEHASAPKVVVFEAYAQDLYGHEHVTVNCAFYWTLGDWWAARPLSEDVDGWFGTVVRNHLADGSALFRYRDRPLNLLKNLGRGYAIKQSPVFGGYEQENHLDRPDERAGAFSRTGLMQHIRAQHLIDGRLAWNTARAAKVERTLVRLREAGSVVLFVDLPPTRFFESGYPEGAVRVFEVRFQEMAGRAGVEFVSGDPLRARLEDHRHFRDANHVNLAGAEVASDWLATEVLGPEALEALGGSGGSP